MNSSALLFDSEWDMQTTSLKPGWPFEEGCKLIDNFQI